MHDENERQEAGALRWVLRCPWIAMALIDAGILLQWVSMLMEHSAKGQNAIGWAAVLLALALWSIVYRTVTPGQRWTVRWSRMSVINAAIALGTVCYFHGGLK